MWQKVGKADETFPMRRGPREAVIESAVDHEVSAKCVRQRPQVPHCVGFGPAAPYECPRRFAPEQRNWRRNETILCRAKEYSPALLESAEIQFRSRALVKPAT
jgi:hypothetical protein